MKRSLVLNADDFGMSADHNLAIMQAHLVGSIQSASLMMGEMGTDEAIDLALRTPTLQVGIHVALTDATPVLPPEFIPEIVQSNGKFHATELGLIKASLTYAGRQQIAAEVEAQFRAFYRSGLPFDHVNTHRHSHQIPSIAMFVFAEARKWGVQTSRLTWDSMRQMRLISDAARLIRYHSLRYIILRAGLGQFIHRLVGIHPVRNGHRKP